MQLAPVTLPDVNKLRAFVLVCCYLWHRMQKAVWNCNDSNPYFFSLHTCKSVDDSLTSQVHNLMSRPGSFLGSPRLTSQDDIAGYRQSGLRETADQPPARPESPGWGFSSLWPGSRSTAVCAKPIRLVDRIFTCVYGRLAIRTFATVQNTQESLGNLV